MYRSRPQMVLPWFPFGVPLDSIRFPLRGVTYTLGHVSKVWVTLWVCLLFLGTPLIGKGRRCHCGVPSNFREGDMTMLQGFNSRLLHPTEKTGPAFFCFFSDARRVFFFISCRASVPVSPASFGFGAGFGGCFRCFWHQPIGVFPSSPESDLSRILGKIGLGM